MRQQTVKQRAEVQAPKDDTAQAQQEQGTTRMHKIDELASWDWGNREEGEKSDIGLEESGEEAESNLKEKGKIGRDAWLSNAGELGLSLVVDFISSSCCRF